MSGWYARTPAVGAYQAHTGPSAPKLLDPKKCPAFLFRGAVFVGVACALLCFRYGSSNLKGALSVYWGILRVPSAAQVATSSSSSGAGVGGAHRAVAVQAAPFQAPSLSYQQQQQYS